MPEAMTATAPVEQDLITEAGESYDLPSAEAISKYTAATCAKLVEEMVKKGLAVNHETEVAGFPKLSLVERRETLIKIINSLTDSEAAESAADQKAGNVVEAAAAATLNPKTGDAGVQATESAAAGVPPVKVKGKPGPKPGSKKGQKGQAGDNQPASPKVVHSGDDDPIFKIACKIEKIANRGELETELRDIVDEASVDEFSLGGLLAKAQATPQWWNEHYKSFREYVEAVVGIKYRRAMYFLETYVGLIKMNKPWSAFQDIGWTKICALTKILEKDTPEKEFKDWVNDAKILTVDALKDKIKNALKPEGEKKSEQETDIKSMTFKLHVDQREVVDAALEVAMKAINTDVKAVGLEAMAQSYMGTGLAFKDWKEAMAYARKHTDDPLSFAAQVLDYAEKICPEVVFPNIELDLRSAEAAE